MKSLKVENIGLLTSFVGLLMVAGPLMFLPHGDDAASVKRTNTLLKVSYTGVALVLAGGALTLAIDKLHTPKK
jgi:hypothetical protein